MYIFMNLYNIDVYMNLHNIYPLAYLYIKSVTYISILFFYNRYLFIVLYTICFNKSLQFE